MKTGTKKSTVKTMIKATGQSTVNGPTKASKNGRPTGGRVIEAEQAKHAAKGGRALLKVWKRIAERSNER